MNKGLSIFICLLLAFTVPVVMLPFAGAEETTSDMMPTDEMSSGETDQDISSIGEVSGEVVSVNAQEGTVVIKYLGEGQNADQAQQETFYVTEATEIEQEGDLIDVSELEAGDDVFVMYTKDSSGKNILDSVFVKS